MLSNLPLIKHSSEDTTTIEELPLIKVPSKTQGLSDHFCLRQAVSFPISNVTSKHLSQESLLGQEVHSILGAFPRAPKIILY